MVPLAAGVSGRPVLRPYQVDAIERLRKLIRANRKRIVLVMPTGGGKTVCAASMIHSALERNSRSLFLAHRRELIDQTLDKLRSFGVQAGVIMAADKRRDDFLPTQVASVQTLVRRLDRRPPAKLVVVDECHHATSETYKKILDTYADAVVIGLTATPWRSDKVGLGDIYEDSVLACTPGQLMESGALVKYDPFAYDAPDLHQVRITAGDFNQHDLGVACNTKVLVGSAVREYVEHASGRRAILFPVNIAHSMHLVDEFRAAGFSAEHVDCNTASEVRSSAMTRFRSGDLTVLSSVGVLTEGFDAPAAEVCLLLRPTKSLTLYLQMVGRVLRPSPETGKQRALVHDHAGNILRHGFPDDERDYSLTVTPDRVRSLHTCPACNVIFAALKHGRCPHCNQLIALPEQRSESGDSQDHVEVEGRRISREEIERIRARRNGLGIERELSDGQVARAASATREEKAAEYLRLKQVAEDKGFQPGFVSHQFRAVFSHWPKFKPEELEGIAPAQRPFFPLERRS